MGTITKTIGTSARDYSTMQAWEDALPANLVTNGNSQVGECYNDSEFTAVGATLLTISGETTDSTHTITLKCATGQSFKDNASVQSNALRYNQSNGVGCSITAYGAGITSTVAFVTIDGLQVKISFNSTPGIYTNGGGDNVVQNCIVSYDGNGANPALFPAGIRDIVRNCVVITGASVGISGGGMRIGNPGLIVVANCTVVRPSDHSSFGLSPAFVTVSGGHYGGVNTIINCAAFGFATFTDDVTNFGAGSTNNCTDLASTGIGSANQVSKTYASQFQGVTTAGGDYRAKAGADLLNNGATDITDIPAAIDIAMTSRPQGAAWDIGAWELVAATQYAAFCTPQRDGAVYTQMTGY